MRAGPGMTRRTRPSATTAFFTRTLDEHSPTRTASGRRILTLMWYLAHDIIINSGPPSCLCSKPEQCEITEDNELDVVPSVVEVKMKIFQIFHFNISIFIMPGVSVSGDVCFKCRVWILHLVNYQPNS